MTINSFARIFVYFVCNPQLRRQIKFLLKNYIIFCLKNSKLIEIERSNNLNINDDLDFNHLQLFHKNSECLFGGMRNFSTIILIKCQQEKQQLNNNKNEQQQKLENRESVVKFLLPNGQDKKKNDLMKINIKKLSL